MKIRPFEHLTRAVGLKKMKNKKKKKNRKIMWVKIVLCQATKAGMGL